MQRSTLDGLAPADLAQTRGAASRARLSAIVAVAEHGGRAGDKPFGTVRRYRDECTLDALNHRGQLDDRRWRAGVLFRRDWMLASRDGRLVAGYTPRISSTGGAGVQRAAQVACMLTGASMPWQSGRGD